MVDRDLCLAVLATDAPYLVDLKTKEKKPIFKDDKADEKERRPAPVWPFVYFDLTLD